MFKKIEDPHARIVFNTAILYIKMLFTICFSFFTIRFLLDALGVENYGIFTLIGGVISLLLFLNSAMTVSTQRYLSYYQGTDDLEMQESVFMNSLVLHFAIGTIIVICLIAAMPIVFNGTLNIESDRVLSAKYLYLCMLCSVFFSILTVPFRASLNAHENIVTDSIVLFIQSFFKLIMAILLYSVIDGDKLVYLGAFLALSNLLALFFYIIYCRRNYAECNLSRYSVDVNLFLELARFAWWNLYTNLCYVLNTQGFNVVFNIFFGAKINAAYGVAFQVNAQIKNLSQSLLRAISPQIMKSEGMTDRERTIRMSLLASKFGFFLVAIAAIPCLFLMENLLELWLINVPEYTVMFCKYFLVATLINQLTVGITPAVQAVGNIKQFQIVIGTVALFTLPVAYMLLSYDYPLSSVFSLIVIVEIVTGVLKILLFQKICDYSARSYLVKVVIRMLVPALVCGAVVHLIDISAVFTYKIPSIILVSSLTYMSLFYFLSLEYEEKISINNFMQKLTSKVSLFNRER